MNFGLDDESERWLPFDFLSIEISHRVCGRELDMIRYQRYLLVCHNDQSLTEILNQDTSKKLIDYYLSYPTEFESGQRHGRDTITPGDKKWQLVPHEDQKRTTV